MLNIPVRVPNTTNIMLIHVVVWLPNSKSMYVNVVDLNLSRNDCRFGRLIAFINVSIAWYIRSSHLNQKDSVEPLLTTLPFNLAYVLNSHLPHFLSPFFAMWHKHRKVVQNPHQLNSWVDQILASKLIVAKKKYPNPWFLSYPELKLGGKEKINL